MVFLIVSCDMLPSTGKRRSKGHRHYERWYQNRWCKSKSGITEYRLRDGTRVDCLTTSYAVEVDFAPKWAESVGQSLYYSSMTGRKPGIVLIMEHPKKDQKYLSRLKKATSGLDIKIWTVKP